MYQTVVPRHSMGGLLWALAMEVGGKFHERTWDVPLVVLALLVGKAIDIGWECLKEKTSKQPGKHFKRS